MMHKLLIPLVVILAFLSCEKNDVSEDMAINDSPFDDDDSSNNYDNDCYQYDEGCEHAILQTSYLDTIYPSPYLGAYPGSWRLYSTGVIEECTHWVNTSVFFPLNNDLECFDVREEQVILPVMDNNRIYKGSRVFRYGLHINRSLFITEVDLEVGFNESTTFINDYWTESSSPHYLTKSFEVLNHYDSLTIDSLVFYDVMETHKKDHYELLNNSGDIYSEFSNNWRTYFAYGIGRIKLLYWTDPIDSDTLRYNLIDYHIESL